MPVDKDDDALPTEEAQYVKQPLLDAAAAIPFRGHAEISEFSGHCRIKYSVLWGQSSSVSDSLVESEA
jgi:hypothetical protein